MAGIQLKVSKGMTFAFKDMAALTAFTKIFESAPVIRRKRRRRAKKAKTA